MIATRNSPISIHALVKRATADVARSPIKFGYFNPRPREEGDLYNKNVVKEFTDFNPRPREEGDSVVL